MGKCKRSAVRRARLARGAGRRGRGGRGGRAGPLHRRVAAARPRRRAPRPAAGERRRPLRGDRARRGAGGGPRALVPVLEADRAAADRPRPYAAASTSTPRRCPTSAASAASTSRSSRTCRSGASRATSSTSSSTPATSWRSTASRSTASTRPPSRSTSTARSACWRSSSACSAPRCAASRCRARRRARAATSRREEFERLRAVAPEPGRRARGARLLVPALAGRRAGAGRSARPDRGRGAAGRGRRGAARRRARPVSDYGRLVLVLAGDHHDGGVAGELLHARVDRLALTDLQRAARPPSPRAGGRGRTAPPTRRAAGWSRGCCRRCRPGSRAAARASLTWRARGPGTVVPLRTATVTLAGSTGGRCCARRRQPSPCVRCGRCGASSCASSLPSWVSANAAPPPTTSSADDRQHDVARRAVPRRRRLGGGGDRGRRAVGQAHGGGRAAAGRNHRTGARGSRTLAGWRRRAERGGTTCVGAAAAPALPCPPAAGAAGVEAAGRASRRGCRGGLGCRRLGRSPAGPPRAPWARPGRA